MGKEIKIEIKNRIMGSILFSYSCEDNTTLKTITKAIESRADLRDADLSDADLSGAYLRGADLSNAYLRNTNLCGADLSGANLRNTNLCSADLRSVYLRNADLRNADLSNAYLCNANIYNADMCGANLCCADLRDADLHDADLRGADLYCANLRNTNLRSADLRNADLSSTKGGYLSCPSEGSFIGWKKATGYIVKLQILDDSRRSSSGGEKCRCDKALVLEIQNLDGSKTDIQAVQSDYDLKFIYRVGTIVEVADYNTDRWCECAPGIHFFIDRRAAVEYN